MPITVEATYENGTLKLQRPLPLNEHEKVQVTIQRQRSPILDSYGLLGWQGSTEDAEFLATDPDLEYSSPEEP